MWYTGTLTEEQHLVQASTASYLGGSFGIVAALFVAGDMLNASLKILSAASVSIRPPPNSTTGSDSRKNFRADGLFFFQIFGI